MGGNRPSPDAVLDLSAMDIPYFNASLLPPMSHSNGATRPSYVVTQHPLPCTVDDFWAMVGEVAPPIVIMLNQTEAKNEVEEYPQYWESSCGGSGPSKFSLSVGNEQNFSAASCHLRDMCLTIEDRTVSFIHATVDDWPDQGVP